MVKNSILQPVTLGYRFTHEHGLMDGLSFSDTPIDSRRREGSGGGGGLGGGGYGIYMEREHFFKNFLVNLWKKRVVWEWECFFPKIP